MTELSPTARPDDDYWMLEWDDSVGIDEVAGGNQPVTARNAHAYVQRKAQHDMVGAVRVELAAIKQGLHDVISPDDLHDLTADDLQVMEDPQWIHN